MKKRWIIIIFCLLLTGCNLETNKKSDFEDFNEILTTYFRSFYAESDKYTKESKEFLEYSTQGGTIEKYFLESNLRYMELILYGEMGKNTYEYYILDATHMYVVLTKHEYDKPFYENPEITLKGIEEYFIIEGNLMVYDIQTMDLIKCKGEQKILEYYKEASNIK